LSIQIFNAHGHVDVEGTEQENISILLEKRIFSRKQSQADEVAEDLRLVVEKDGANIHLSTNREDLRKRRFRTNFKILIPEQMAVFVKNSYGEVRVSQAGETEIRNPNGRVYADNIVGNLTVENSYKEVEVENIRADCRIKSKNSTVTAVGIDGLAHFEHRYGKIWCENIGQSVTVDGSNAEIYGQNITGLTDIRTSYRKIDLSEVGPVKIRASNSRIEITDAKDSVDIENKYGKIELYDIDGNLRIDGRNLEVYGHSIIGENIFISTSYRKVELVKFQGKTEIIHSNGDIGLEPNSLTYPIEVQGRYSDIRLFWQSGWRYPFEARAKGGDIDWNVSEGLSHDEENGYKVIKAFETETDKPNILLNTTYGRITIEEY
jgi:hypothetical protein